MLALFTLKAVLYIHPAMTAGDLYMTLGLLAAEKKFLLALKI